MSYPMIKECRFLVFASLLTAAIGICSGNEPEQAGWASWRGPQADGHSAETELPQQWSPASIKWKSSLPGTGQSSPIIWEDHIFLTSSLQAGRQRLVFCIRRSDGKKLWEQIAWTGEPEPTHEMNGWASASCVTDGERVIAFFGRGGGLHCFTIEGQHVWSRDLGAFDGPWGTAASPIIVRNMVIQNCDSDAGAFLIAVDKETGKDIWKAPRPSFRGWSTPVLIQTPEREELVLNGHTGVTAYDPNSGKQLWHCHCSEGRGSPTVTPAGDRLFVLNGLSGGGAYCVQPGGTGDVTNTRRQWMTRRGGRDLPSPIIIGNSMLAMSLRSSMLVAYDTRDGAELWSKRIGGQISASPIAYGGRAFFIDETGRTLVIEPDSTDKVVAINTIGASEGELFRASISPFQGELFIRSNSYLYCVAGDQ